MTLEAETNPTVQSLRIAARELAALADAVGEQVRPAVKFTVDRVDDIAAALGTSVPHVPAEVPLEAKSAKESLDEVARDFGALADAVGDQLRPAIKAAVATADGIAAVVEAARTRLWKSLIELGAEPAA